MKKISRRAKTVLLTVYLLAATVLTVAATSSAFAHCGSKILGIDIAP